MCCGAPDRMSEALSRAWARVDVVIMTGCMGPTPDDITLKSVATVLGRPLSLEENVLASIRERIARYKWRMPK